MTTSERWAAALMGNYGTPPLTLVRGSGSTVVDDGGRSYLDLLGGIAVSSLGHAHPAVVSAVSEQVGRIAHTSNLYVNQPALALAERLVALTGRSDARVFFANSGAEANEAALKLARRHHGGTRTAVVAAVGAFHGRTFGALSVTGQPAKRAPFEPLPGPVSFVEYGDEQALAAAVTEETAAVVLEPVLGESGVVVPPPGYLAAARSACDATGALLVLDEVQGGIGRTGEWLAHHHERLGPDCRPDVVTLAKGLGAGLPIGACVGFGAAARAFQRGDHGSTFGGNPVSAAAALAVLDTIEHDGLLAHVTALGQQWLAALGAVDHPLLGEVAGLGLWLGLQLTAPVAAQVELAAREAGFLVNAATADRVRLAPPLVLTAAEAASFTAALPAVLDAAARVAP